MSKSRKIGEVRTSVNYNSKTHRIRYFVLDKDVVEYTPLIKETAAWAPGDCVVSDFSKIPSGPHWIFDITAVPRQDGYSEFNTDDPNEFTKKSYEVTEFFFEPEFWGVRRAEEEDELSQKFNIYNRVCKKGDYLYRDATESSAGNADFSLSPFLDNFIGTGLIGQTVKTSVFSCTFYSRKNVNHFAGFKGVNGSFSAKCRPAVTTASRWKADSQRIDTELDKDGKLWARVARSLILAPAGLRWDPGKNGGTWTW
jgi:hypothetical protein